MLKFLLLRCVVVSWTYTIALQESSQHEDLDSVSSPSWPGTPTPTAQQPVSKTSVQVAVCVCVHHCFPLP